MPIKSQCVTACAHPPQVRPYVYLPHSAGGSTLSRPTDAARDHGLDAHRSRWAHVALRAAAAARFAVRAALWHKRAACR